MYLKTLKNNTYKFQNLTTNLKSWAHGQILVSKTQVRTFLGKVLSEYDYVMIAKFEKCNAFWVLFICQINRKGLFWLPTHWVVPVTGEHLCLMRISKYLALTLKLVLDWAHKRLHTHRGMYPSSLILNLGLVGTMAFGKQESLLSHSLICFTPAESFFGQPRRRAH